MLTPAPPTNASGSISPVAGSVSGPCRSCHLAARLLLPGVLRFLLRPQARSVIAVEFRVPGPARGRDPSRGKVPRRRGHARSRTRGGRRWPSRPTWTWSLIQPKLPEDPRRRSPGPSLLPKLGTLLKVRQFNKQHHRRAATPGKDRAARARTATGSVNDGWTSSHYRRAADYLRQMKSPGVILGADGTNRSI